MSCMRFNARLDTSHHGLPHPCKDAGLVSNSLTGIHNVMSTGAAYTRDFMFPHRQEFRALRSGERGGIQWVLFYLSVGHESCC
jgi:hypothetical protein